MTTDASSGASSGRQRPRATPVAAGTLPAAAFAWPYTVRFSDCDPAGIVYTPNFINMANGAVETFFNQALKIDYGGVIFKRRTGLGYASVDCDFFRPAQMGDELRFTPLVRHIGGASAVFVVHGHRGADEVVRCHMVMVSTSVDSMKPIPLPDDIRAGLTAYRQACG